MVPMKSFVKEGYEPDAGHVIQVNGVSVLENDDAILSNVSFSLVDNEHIVVVGANYRAGQVLTRLLIGLQEPHEGKVLIDGVPSSEISRSRMALVFTYIDTDPRFFTGSILQNLAYGLPNTSPSGWRDEALDALHRCGLGKELFDFGLDARIDLSHDHELQQKILSVRAQLHQRLEELDGGRLFRPFRVDEYNEHATVLENLLFGSIDKDLIDNDQLIGMRWFSRVLKKFGLDESLEQLGLTAVKLWLTSPNSALARARVPREVIEMFNDRASELQTIADTVGSARSGPLLKSQRRLLLNLALELVIDRTELSLPTDELKTKIVASRKAMRAHMEPSVRRAAVFFDTHAYNPTMRLRDNLLFGRPNVEERKAALRVVSVLEETIKACGLHNEVVRAALDYDIGVAGSNLSREQTQKLGLARALLMPAKMVIASYAMSAHSIQDENMIVKTLTASMSGRGLVWITDRAELAQYFDRAMVFAGGSLKTQGNVSDLQREGTLISRQFAES
jgi:putative ABC transport system ATP-binding protein